MRIVVGVRAIPFEEEDCCCWLFVCARSCRTAAATVSRPTAASSGKKHCVLNGVFETVLRTVRDEEEDLEAEADNVRVTERVSVAVPPVSGREAVMKLTVRECVRETLTVVVSDEESERVWVEERLRERLTVCVCVLVMMCFVSVNRRHLGPPWPRLHTQ